MNILAVYRLITGYWFKVRYWKFDDKWLVVDKDVARLDEDG